MQQQISPDELAQLDRVRCWSATLTSKGTRRSPLLTLVPSNPPSSHHRPVKLSLPPPSSTMLASLALLLLAGSQLAPASALPRRLDSPLDRRAPPSLAARRPKPPAAAQPLSPRDIQGSGWLSSYDGQTVNDVQGIVTAKS